MPQHDHRLQELTAWFERQLPGLHPDNPSGSLTPASSDASFRRYFRWQGQGRSLILMDAPPPQENCRPFVRMAALLGEAGVHVPRVLAEDLQQGFLLLDDLGRQTFLDVIDTGNADALFNAAIDALLALQAHPLDESLPRYDEALLRRELELFPEWYVRRHLGWALSPAQLSAWQQVSDLLIDSALAQPKVLVHRDYMPRNLMLSEPNPGVLDFQDAVIGPVTYDITSLFKDAFVSWPEERVHDWLALYWRRAGELGIPVQAQWRDFLRASDLMGVQRHLKVIGIFSRICHRDGKPRYLADVPRFFGYIRTVLARRPELRELGVLLDELASLPAARVPS
ncbi:aminoglycoside phosphotransferase family protein [Stutzerimonas kirkiae]|uniref:Aminoglycoside phosphotransferase n=1 Tax=Stutzerimonas kirkiae TaxID=2211392 RepID=A0A4Q9R0U0_9GAMM|nr:phosphotransferase [Stutzerimonas kirkiae]TBU92199.1 aminoglycoside phosphotransferase [Stutzerimonas kirkiae]TBV01179.1 aminoglycoside phosphotransferase [Stutzerimonas kirkiae]TBV10482.1 aminoglycoside phosphotransferase [Stutzerimonas kirkiae]TBV13962.1 aminoglycoside phosphotransferase [Stutzerimonas kirkiae]